MKFNKRHQIQRTPAVQQALHHYMQLQIPYSNENKTSQCIVNVSAHCELFFLTVPHRNILTYLLTNGWHVLGSSILSVIMAYQRYANSLLLTNRTTALKIILNNNNKLLNWLMLSRTNSVMVKQIPSARLSPPYVSLWIVQMLWLVHYKFLLLSPLTNYTKQDIAHSFISALTGLVDLTSSL